MSLAGLSGVCLPHSWGLSGSHRGRKLALTPAHPHCSRPQLPSLSSRASSSTCSPVGSEEVAGL